MTLVVTGVGAWCAAGRGVDALLGAAVEQRACFSQAPYATAGMAQPRGGFIPGLDRDSPAYTLLSGVVADALASANIAACPVRTGLIVGTSSGAISGLWSSVLDGPAEPRQAPTLALAKHLGLSGAVLTVGLACASGTAAFDVASGWLREGRVDRVIVAGVDALSLFIHAGFAGLGALSATTPKPFQTERDGLLLGEGAAALIIETRESAARRRAPMRATLLGTGLAGDAFHMTAPHRDGRGAAAGMRASLADAGVEATDIDLVSAHATATPFNDAMEAKAIRTVFGDGPLMVHALKGCIGHTLGAAGALEAALIVAAIERRTRLPAVENPAPDCPLPQSASNEVEIALSSSSAFGGANASAVFGLASVQKERADPAHRTRVVGNGRVDLPAGEADWRELWSDRPPRFGRMDRYVRVVLLAIHRALGDTPLQPDTGIVLATRHGCAMADQRYLSQLLDAGPQFISRLDFMYTVPGGPAAEAAILWDLRGPQLAVLGSGGEAAAIGRRWIRDGLCREVIVVSADALGLDNPAHATAQRLCASPADDESV